MQQQQKCGEENRPDHFHVEEKACYDKKRKRLENHDNELDGDVREHELERVDAGHGRALEQTFLLLNHKYQRSETNCEYEYDCDHDARCHEIDKFRIRAAVDGVLHHWQVEKAWIDAKRQHGQNGFHEALIGFEYAHLNNQRDLLIFFLREYY